MSENSDELAPGHVRSVDRAVTILEFLARNGWSGVTDVGHALGVHKSTAFRLLSTLEARGLVEQHVDSGKYRLGFGLVQLAHAVGVGPDIRHQARAGCEWLAEQTEETITLAVLEGGSAVTIDQIVSTSTVASRSWLGRSTPLHCTSPGKVFLASMSDEEFADVVGRGLERSTERTIIDPDVLAEHVRQVRADGYATTIDEFEDGLSSTAAPVLATDGSVVAAIVVSGPTQRLDEGRLTALAPLVREAGARASASFTTS